MREDWMSKVAVLGRGSSLTALPLLSSLLSHMQQQVAQAISSGLFHPLMLGSARMCLVSVNFNSK